jgi:hypothetical protein
MFFPTFEFPDIDIPDINIPKDEPELASIEISQASLPVLPSPLEGWENISGGISKKKTLSLSYELKTSMNNQRIDKTPTIGLSYNITWEIL